jgi:DNA-directed RNA polymerase specialized sigma24 family protein
MKKVTLVSELTLVQSQLVAQAYKLGLKQYKTVLKPFKMSDEQKHDILMQCVISISRSICTFDPNKSSMKNFVNRVLKNEAKSQIKAKSYTNTVSLDSAMEDAESTISDKWLYDNSAMELHNAYVNDDAFSNKYQKLSPIEAKILEMYNSTFDDGSKFTMLEIAERVELGCSVSKKVQIVKAIVQKSLRMATEAELEIVQLHDEGYVESQDKARKLGLSDDATRKRLSRMRKKYDFDGKLGNKRELDSTYYAHKFIPNESNFVQFDWDAHYYELYKNEAEASIVRYKGI